MNGYNPTRSPNWNYGGKYWKLSRSKIELYQKCPLCFYLDNKLGTKQPPSYPFNLNIAVDELLKKEFDLHRDSQTPHAIMSRYNISAVPFNHPEIHTWRANFTGLTAVHAETGLTVQGAVDDLWINPQGELIVVDYKATSAKDRIENLDKAWHQGYKRQMEVYQWLYRQNGFTVSDTGYFLYANADKKPALFDSCLTFDLTLIPYVGSDAWIQPTLLAIKECLESSELPAAGAGCDVCRYSLARVTHVATYSRLSCTSCMTRLPPIEEEETALGLDLKPC